ncbi:hypothetical protein FIBSPDRAFT_954973 [Athelia psychrophila]|uniref:Uncharacterized protein n=1 Tax=Athelia psychrophila TaxID=1759441 RepID=A0A166IJY9_9AGAM|nr:hypothetical protein FIBSPDRAFT_954973 [Fibularhizoctonia sp. CBS 109695]
MASSSNHASSDSESSSQPRSGKKCRAKTLLDTLTDGGRKKRKSCIQIDEKAKEVRTSDSGALKHSIVPLLPKNLTTDAVLPPIPPKSSSKANRGYNHPQIARMLCPRDRLVDFDSDASVIDQLQAGSIPVTPGDWATFLYNEEEEYDAENPAQGLFRGYLLIRVAKHIFTGPSSASKSKAGAGKSTRASNAKIHGMKRFTARTIAYVVVQTWFALSSMEAWDAEAEGFSLLELFNLTVEQFEDGPQSEWAVSTLAFFDEHVFGRRSPAVPEVTEEPAARRETAAERMKRIRAKAKATPVSSGSNSSG